jgi:hypothetical protein
MHHWCIACTLASSECLQFPLLQLQRVHQHGVTICSTSAAAAVAVFNRNNSQGGGKQQQQ